MNQLTAHQTEAATNGCCPPVPSSANVKDLELSYPQLLSRSSAMTATDHQGATGTTSRTGTHAGVLDWTNIVQACQTLSSEILLGMRHGNYLTRVMPKTGLCHKLVHLGISL